MRKYYLLHNQQWLSGRFKTLMALVCILTGITQVQAANIVGGVWDDTNGNAAKVAAESWVNGTTTSIWANLVDISSNQVVSQAKLLGGGGFTVTGAVNGAAYKLILTTIQPAIGSVLTTASLPLNWVHTGTNISASAATIASGSTANQTGIMDISMPATGNLANRYFGMEQLPTATSITAAPQQNPGGNYRVPVIAPNATDAEEGNLWATGTGTIKIETLASNGTLYYNGIAVTAGQTISNFNDALLMLDPADGAFSTSFTYSSIDAAGRQSPSTGTVTMPFTEPTAIACDSYLYQVAGEGNGSNLYRYNPFTGTRSTGIPLGVEVNGVGYNSVDNLIWGASDGKLTRIDANGNVAQFIVPNLPTGGYNVGEVLPGGYLYLTYSASTKVFVVDINPSRSTYLQLVEPNGHALDTAPYGTNFAPAGNYSDWAYNPATGLLYAIRIEGTAPYLLRVVTINPTTLSTTIAGTTLSGGGIQGGNNATGALFFDNTGNLYMYGNATGKYFRVDITTNIATYLSTSIANISTDGASCPTAQAFQVDLGDAPDAFGTVLNSGGPSHVLSANLKIGTVVDAENDAQPNATANGDDLNGTPDDEDGLPSIPSLSISATTYSLNVAVTNTTGANATLSGWVDFNRNNIFAASERVQVTVPNGATSVVLTWTGLSGLAEGQSYIRLRLASTASEVANAMGDAGSASDGEVEDYSVIINNSPDLTPTITMPSTTLSAGSSKDFVVKLSEIKTIATSSQIAFNLVVPAGYTLTMDPSAVSVSVTGAGNLPVTNGQWDVITTGTNQLDLISKPGVVINAGSFAQLGFRILRNSATTAGSGNIVISIYPDPTMTYDSDNANNLYNRTITGN